MKAAFVTGGGGYLGCLLCQELVKQGYLVTAFDVAFPSADNEHDVNKVQGDVTDGAGLEKALRISGASVLFHLASYGMSGKEQLNRRKIENVNIQGTRNVIEACVSCGVEALVYTSTFNVVFGGQEIVNGREEDLPYFPLNKHVDHYSRTKSIAEQAVLSANGSPLLLQKSQDTERDREEQEEEEDGALLKTCALRCAGIYGEGEQRHLPRIVGYIESGLFQFTYGSKDSLVEFLHGDNFVQAHIKAAEALQQPDSSVAGEAYFISDGHPINNFEFFRPLCEGLGYHFPEHRLPISLVFYMAFVIEIVHSVVCRYFFNFQPLLTRAEVYKTGVTHYFSLDKARSDFGYTPQSHDLSGVVKWFRDRGRGKPTANHTSWRDTGKIWLLNHRLLLILLITISSLYILSDLMQ